MDTSSSGYRYWTTYEAGGDKARITAHYMWEQTPAAIAGHAGFSLRVYGLGGGLNVTVRTARRRRRAAPRSARPVRCPGEQLDPHRGVLEPRRLSPSSTA